MQTAYQNLNHTRLELEHAKAELEKVSRPESELRKVQPKIVKHASPMVPEISSVSSLPEDWFKQIEQIGREMDKRLAHVEKQLESQRQSQYSREYIDLRNDVGSLELSLNARIDEVLFRFTALEGSMKAMGRNLCNESVVQFRTESNDSNEHNVAARSSNRNYWMGLGFKVGGIRKEEDTDEGLTRNKTGA